MNLFSAMGDPKASAVTQPCLFHKQFAQRRFSQHTAIMLTNLRVGLGITSLLGQTKSQ
jgi:hypothetical protein